MQSVCGPPSRHIGPFGGSYKERCVVVVVVAVSVEVCAFVRGWDPMFCCLPKITVDVISEMELTVG